MDAASQKPQPDQQGDDKPANHDKKRIDWKRVRFTAAVITIIEIVSYVLWQEADDFSGLGAVLIHWCSKCGGLLGAAVIAHKIAETVKRQVRVWIVYAALCAVMLAIPTSNLYRHKTVQQTREETAPVVGWQPPELPTDCTNVCLNFGSQRLSAPVWMAMAPPLNGPYSAQFSRAEAPPELTNHWPSSAKSVFARSVWRCGINGHDVDLPVAPYVKNRRLYVFGQIPYGKDMRKIEMSNDWDSKLPPEWDRNFSPNAFEIVNDDGRPVLQVTYRRSDEVDVSGLFVIGKNELLSAFGSLLVVFSPQTNGLYNAHIETSKPSTNREGFLFDSTNPYATTLSTQKCIFKYPSWKYPGVLAE